MNANISPDEEKYRQALRNGGYDFTDEETWLRQQRTGPSVADRERARKTVEEFITMMPTFAREYESHQLEEYALAKKPFQRIIKDARLMVQ